MTFWQWAVYAFLGVIAVSLLPENISIVVVVILILGGILYIESSRASGFKGFISTLEGKPAE